MVEIVWLAGVTLFDALEAELVPVAFVAVTANVYPVPFVRPVTVSGLAEPVAVKLPGVEVAVKLVATPPVLVGVKLTVACAFPATAVPIVGALGAAVGVKAALAVDRGPLPCALLAKTVAV